MDKGLKGALRVPSASLMECPPEQWSDEAARQRLERFIDGASSLGLAVTVGLRW